MRRSRYVAIVLLVLLGGCGGIFAWRWEQRGPGRASITSAIGRYRALLTGLLASGRASRAA